MFESQLMQIPGPRDIVIYRPDPRAFSVVQSLGAGHTFRCKSHGYPVEIATGQIDTCIRAAKDNGKEFGSKLAASFSVNRDLKQQDAVKLLKFSQPRFHLNENLPVDRRFFYTTSSCLSSLLSIRAAGINLGMLFTLKPLTALSVGNKAAKVKTTLLVSMSDFMIISFQRKT